MTTPAILSCPHCGARHVDKGRWALFDHRKHLCFGCGRFFEVPEPNVGVEGPSPAAARPPGFSDPQGRAPKAALKSGA
jgi:hypothetical protein